MSEIENKSFIFEDNTSLERSIDFNKSFSFINTQDNDNSNSDSLFPFYNNKKININNTFPPNYICFYPYIGYNISPYHNIFLNNMAPQNKLNNFIKIPPLLQNQNQKNKITESKSKNPGDKINKQKKEENKNNKNNKNIINVEQLMLGKDKRNCVRLMPIPNKFSPYDIIRIIDKILQTVPGKRIYKSIYVPLTKKIGKNIGFCFIELVSAKYVIEFYKKFHGFLFKKCKKPCQVTFSDIQKYNDIDDNPFRNPIVFKDIIKE